MNKQETVLLDAEGKRLVLKGEVCLREGLLEMLVCLKQTKEHESILSVATKAQTVHAGLLALFALDQLVLWHIYATALLVGACWSMDWPGSRRAHPAGRSTPWAGTSWRWSCRWPSAPTCRRRSSTA